MAPAGSRRVFRRAPVADRRGMHALRVLPPGDHGLLVHQTQVYRRSRGDPAPLVDPLVDTRGDLADLVLAFGIVLNRSGWRIDYLGSDTPVEELSGTVKVRHPDLVVLAATLPGTLEPLTAQLIVLAQRAPLVLGRSGRHAPAGRRRAGPAADQRPGQRGRECRVAAVTVLHLKES